MEYRTFGRTGWNISAIGFGAWGIGGDAWGPTDDKTSLATLNRAIDLGVNFFDTADRYGKRLSEEQKADIRKVMAETQGGLEKMRAYALENGDQPATVLKFTEGEKNNGHAQ